MRRIPIVATLIVLVAEHVNRRELKPELATGLRYTEAAMKFVDR